LGAIPWCGFVSFARATLSSSFTGHWFRSTRGYSPGSGTGNSPWLKWTSDRFADFPSATGAEGCSSGSPHGHLGKSSSDKPPCRVPSRPLSLPSYARYPVPGKKGVRFQNGDRTLELEESCPRFGTDPLNSRGLTPFFRAHFLKSDCAGNRLSFEF
jgi:hypothetical protein